MKRKIDSWPWLVVYGLFGAACVFRVSADARTIAEVYGRGVYPVAQGMLRACFSWWPFPASVVLIGLAVGVTGWAIYRSTRGEAGWPVKAARSARVLTRAFAVIGLWFLLGWGINYGRASVPDQLGLSPKPADSDTSSAAAGRQLLSTETLLDEATSQVELVNRLRAVLPQADVPVAPTLDAEASDDLTRELIAVLDLMDFSTVNAGRVRVLPAGTLLRFGTAGVYSPWTADPHVDGGLHPLQLPFTALHELAHAQGITDEGDCNLLAYLAGRRSADPYVRYSAELTYFRYLRAALSRRDRVSYASVVALVSPAVAADLAAIAVAMDRFREIAPAARDFIYDRYLKTQGVSEGLASYGRIIDWVVAGKRARPELFGGAPPTTQTLPR